MALGAEKMSNFNAGYFRVTTSFTRSFGNESTNDVTDYYPYLRALDPSPGLHAEREATNRRSVFMFSSE